MKNPVIPSNLLMEKIDESIELLLPLFNASQNDVKQFGKPRLRRRLKPTEHIGHSRDIPGYDYLENYFHFPLRSKWDGVLNVFGNNLINHEVGHYIHNIINPWHKKWLDIFKKMGKPPVGTYDLLELVANYPNFILKILSQKEVKEHYCLKDKYEIFNCYGPNFLQKLARMNLEEAIKEGIIIISNQSIPEHNETVCSYL